MTYHCQVHYGNVYIYSNCNCPQPLPLPLSSYSPGSDLLIQLLLVAVTLWIQESTTYEQSSGELELEMLEPKSTEAMSGETKPKRPVTPTGEAGQPTAAMTSMTGESMGGSSVGPLYSSGASGGSSGGARPRTLTPSSSVAVHRRSDIDDESLVSHKGGATAGREDKITVEELVENMSLAEHNPQGTVTDGADSSKSKQKIPRKDKSIKEKANTREYSTNRQSGNLNPVITKQSLTSPPAQTLASFSGGSPIASSSSSSSGERQQSASPHTFNLDLREGSQVRSEPRERVGHSTAPSQQGATASPPRIAPTTLVRHLEDVVSTLEIWLGPDKNATVKNWRNWGSKYGVHTQEMDHLADCAPERKVRKLFQLKEFEMYTVAQLVEDLKIFGKTGAFERLRKHGMDC